MMDSQCTSIHQKDKSIGSMLMFTELNEVWHQSNNIITRTILLLEKWFPLQGERAHCLKLFCMYDKRFEISKTK